MGGRRRKRRWIITRGVMRARALGARIVEGDDLHLFAVLVDLKAAHVALVARRDLLEHLPARDVDAHELRHG